MQVHAAYTHTLKPKRQTPPPPFASLTTVTITVGALWSTEKSMSLVLCSSKRNSSFQDVWNTLIPFSSPFISPEEDKAEQYSTLHAVKCVKL